MTRFCIDDLVRVIGLLANPYLCSLIPVTILTSTTHGTDSLYFLCGLAFSCILWVAHFTRRLNAHYARASLSPAPHSTSSSSTSSSSQSHSQSESQSRGQSLEQSPSLDRRRVVVISGGSNGLGSCLARLLSRSCTVINLDVTAPIDPIDGIHTILCDVSSSSQVTAARSEILEKYGFVDVVISNAAVMSVGGILDTDPDSSTTLSLLRVNVLSQFVLARTFMSVMTTPGTCHWITIASSLGYVGVDCLGGYCASKAAVISFHESLTTEVRRLGRDIEMTLIVPGQLDTQLFSEVVTPNKFLAPVQSAWELAKCIVDKIERRQGGVFGYPLYANYMGLLRCLPTGLVRLIRNMAGLDAAAVQMAQAKAQTQAKQDNHKTD